MGVGCLWGREEPGAPHGCSICLLVLRIPR